MMLWLRRTSVLAIYLVFTTARAAQVGSVEEGYRLAREMCSECHLLGKEEGLSNNANAPTFKEVANTSGMTGAALRSSFQSWHNNMPNLIITVEQEDNLV